MSERRNCISHCTGCDSHFSGDSAFDRHRRDVDGERVCLEPADVRDKPGRAVFAAKTTEGVCALRGGPPLVGVTIWALRESLEAAERFAGAA